MNAPLAQTAAVVLNAFHTRELMGIASMHHLCSNLLTHYCKSNGVDPTALVGVLDRCVESHLFDRNIERTEYDAGMRALHRAAKKVEEQEAASS